VITVVRVLDWPIGVHGFPDEERRILDVELAKKLGFKKPRDIRELIERHEKSGDLPGVFHRRTVRRWKTGRNELAREVTEYWLTMEEALFVTAKSETKTANEILKAVIKVFVAAREAHERDTKNRVGYIARLLLSETTCEWDLMWPPEFVQAMCKLHGVAWDGGSQPMFLASTYEKIYRALLGDEAYAELKKLNPEPQFGSNHHQWLQPLARDRLAREIPKITLLAKQCATKDEFWARFEHEYQGRMLQLSMLVPDRKAS
jgi:hypothetical protein